MLAGCVASLAVAGAVYVDCSVWGVCIAVFVVCCALAYLAVNSVAVRTHAKYLSVLYLAMKPRDFIRLYEELTGTKKLRPNVRFTVNGYLCDAYAAAGEFKKALAILDAAPEIRGRQGEKARSIAAAKRCSIYLFTGDTDKAEKQLELVTSDKELVGIQSKEMLCVRLSCRRGSCTEADADAIRESFKQCSLPLNRAEMNFLSAAAYLRLGKRQLAEQYLTEAAKAGEQLWISRKAQEMRKKPTI